MLAHNHNEPTASKTIPQGILRLDVLAGSDQADLIIEAPASQAHALVTDSA